MHAEQGYGLWLCFSHTWEGYRYHIHIYTCTISVCAAYIEEGHPVFPHFSASFLGKRDAVCVCFLIYVVGRNLCKQYSLPPPPTPICSCNWLLKHLLLHFCYSSSGIFSSPFFPLNNSWAIFSFLRFLKKQLCQLFFFKHQLFMWNSQYWFLLSLLWKCLK